MCFNKIKHECNLLVERNFLKLVQDFCTNIFLCHILEIDSIINILYCIQNPHPGMTKDKVSRLKAHSKIVSEKFRNIDRSIDLYTKTVCWFQCEGEFQ